MVFSKKISTQIEGWRRLERLQSKQSSQYLAVSMHINIEAVRFKSYGIVVYGIVQHSIKSQGAALFLNLLWCELCVVVGNSAGQKL